VHIYSHWILQQQNVLISQGWCTALGVPVPTPFFLQEFLLGTFLDEERAFGHIASLVKIFLTLEISDLDRKFHEDIMDGEGRWWVTDGAAPLSFDTLWGRLEGRSAVVSN
jgi:hypothetical protein